MYFGPALPLTLPSSFSADPVSAYFWAISRLSYIVPSLLGILKDSANVFRKSLNRNSV